MQRYYEGIVKSINNLTRSIRGASLNKEEYDAVWGKLKRLEEQLLPLTLTNVPKKINTVAEPTVVEPVNPLLTDVVPTDKLSPMEAIRARLNKKKAVN